MQKQPKEVKEESIDDIIKINPTLLDYENNTVKKVGIYYLPFSTGFEIECFKNENFSLEIFESIPDIIEVNVDMEEQRFRIPNGILGLNCLYNISIALKEYSLLNKESGIHYHIDFTDYYSLLNKEVIEDNKNWMLNILDKWKYKGTYNSRNIRFSTSHNWIRFQSTFKTMEVRIGEMTFDYSLLFKRIIDCNEIAYKLKEHIINVSNPSYFYNKENIKEILNNRTLKITL